MQKTKNQTNSSNRLTIVPKKLWKSRAKSQTRVPANATCAWMPEGNCCWKTENGCKVNLSSSNLLLLSEVERLTLQQMALSKLRAMNLNCKIDIPKVDSSALKTKRRTVLLRVKAKTITLDGKEKKDIPSENSMFGVPLQQCIQNERLTRHRGSVQPLLAVDDAVNSPNFLDDVQLGARSKRNSLCPDNVEAQTEYNESYQCNVETSEPQIPNVVSSCVRHLEEYGLHTLGLFRVTSSKRRVRQLREDLESGSIVNLNENHHPHDVAQLLKEYFRDLPEPLLTRDLYSCFVAAQRQRDENKQLDIIRYLMYLLPVQNRDTLWTLLHFLSNVARNASDTRNINGVWQMGNKMDSSNLATLFGPNILHTLQKKGKDYEYVVERVYKPEECCDVISVVQKLIDNYRKLFTVTADDLDSAYRRLLLEDPDALQNLLNKLYIHNLESKAKEKSYSDEYQTYVQEVKIERSRSREKKTVVLPIITISSDNKSSKTKTLLNDDDSNNTLAPPGFRDDSPSLRRKSFPDQIIDRTSLLEVNPAIKTPTFTLFVSQDNSYSENNDSVTMAESKVETLDYCKITNRSKTEEYLTLSADNVIQNEEPSLKGRKYLKKPDNKFHIEKSASASSISGNKIQEKREKTHKTSKHSSKVNSKQSGTNISSKMISFITNSKFESNSRPSNRSTSRNHTSAVHYQQERWKRWEIIASEHTEV